MKEQAYRVAGRYGTKVFVVANSYLQVPPDPLIERVVVGSGLDAVDDWIANRIGRGDIVVTADVPLAARAVAAGADAIAPNGRAFTPDSIGMALAARDLMTDLRASGAITGGPKPFSARDRSAFLAALDLAIVRLRRAGFGGSG